MKTNFKLIIPLLLFSAILILLAGCLMTPTDESPGTTTELGTITGTIAAPCCSLSEEPVTENVCLPAEYWCCYCQANWLEQDGIEVVLTYGEDEIASTTTNEEGEYIFNNVAPGHNYVITAYCPDYNDNRPLIKDVALEVASSFDTGITDLASTSLGLVVDFLVYFTEWGPEDISLDEVIADQPTYPNFPKFKALIYEVRRVVENCELNLLTDDDVQFATCRAAEEISGLDIGCAPGETGGGGNPCDNNNAPSINSVLLDGTTVSVGETVSVVLGTPYTITINASDDGIKDDLVYYASVEGVASAVTSSKQVTVTPTVPGSFTVYTFADDGCVEEQWGPVTVEVDCCILDPILDIDIDIQTQRALAPLCLDDCAIIKSVTVNYTDGTPSLTITDLTDEHLEWTWDSGISFVDSTGKICLEGGLAGTPGTYAVSVVYTDECENTANASVSVTFEDCSLSYNLTMIVDPIGKGTTVPTVTGSPHNYPDGQVVTLTANAITGWHFVNWTGDASGTNPTTTVTMDSDKSVTANFEEDDPCLDNHAPMIGFIPKQQIERYHTYHYTVPASDIDLGDSLFYALTDKPSGMTIDSSTGYITWWANCWCCCYDIDLRTDRCHVECRKSVTVKVTDICGKTDEKTFEVEVWVGTPY